ncbi:hypothetical protein N403_03780 [Helicobacter pylori FD430]|nr:hypothetical protein N403_03780 [Helicobacter pylori FD430]EQL76409.1 hypothetical protein N410_04895 [Helicobacter pylori GC26]
MVFLAYFIYFWSVFYHSLDKMLFKEWV